MARFRKLSPLWLYTVSAIVIPCALFLSFMSVGLLPIGLVAQKHSAIFESLILNSETGTGEELKHEFEELKKAPLADDIEYDYHQLSLSQDNEAEELLFVSDFSDPFVYLFGDFFLFEFFDPIQINGVGLSWEGDMEVETTYTKPLGDLPNPFKANFYIDGEAPLNPFPLTLDGAIAYNLNPNNDSLIEFFEQQLVADGELEVDANICGLVNIDFDIGPATVAIETKDGERVARVLGQLLPDSFVIPENFPIRPSNASASPFDVNLTLHEVSLEGCVIDVEGNFVFNSTPLGDSLGLALNDLLVTGARLRIDKTGLLLVGYTNNQIHSGIDASSAMEVEIFISNHNPLDTRVKLTGDLSVAQIDLSANAYMLVKPTKFAIHGGYSTPIQTITMSGELTPSGVSLTGTTEVSIPMIGIETIAEEIVSGAICGFKTVTDATICGVDSVRDVAICGTKTVTSAAYCGTETIIDGLKCGWDTVSGGVCSVVGGCKKKPKKCKVAKTCTIVASCLVPRTCTDYSRPLSCIQTTQVNVPTGSVDGVLTVTLSENGLSGEMEGEYCFRNYCAGLPEIEVSFGNKTKVCAIHSEFNEGCVNF